MDPRNPRKRRKHAMDAVLSGAPMCSFQGKDGPAHATTDRGGALKTNKLTI